jgi:hypothetical protein
LHRARSAACGVANAAALTEERVCICDAASGKRHVSTRMITYTNAAMYTVQISKPIAHAVSKIIHARALRRDRSGGGSFE